MIEKISLTMYYYCKMINNKTQFFFQITSNKTRREIFSNTHNFGQNDSLDIEGNS
jgi:hypothetical protein